MKISKIYFILLFLDFEMDDNHLENVVIGQ